MKEDVWLRDPTTGVVTVNNIVVGRIIGDEGGGANFEPNVSEGHLPWYSLGNMMSIVKLMEAYEKPFWDSYNQYLKGVQPT